jgi:uncharacterized membrane protein
MKKFSHFVGITVASGILILAPIYLALLLLVKAAQSISEIARPLTSIVPEWLPAERFLSLLLVLIICFLAGLSMRTPAGRAAWDRLENSLFQKIPGYAVVRSFTHRVAGENQDNTWKPALAEIEEALVPAFIIESLEDGRFTVFVPSIPTPLAGSVYVLTPERVHPLRISFTEAVRAISRWGSGCKDLVAAMEGNGASGVIPRAPAPHRAVHSSGA